MISTLIALPYELARLPLVLVDGRLSGVLPETSLPRLAVDRVIGSADRLAGTLLHNGQITRRGADRLERSDKLVAAARLEREAARRREQGRDTAATAREEAAQKRTAAQERAASGLDEADAAEARGKQRATAEAAKKAAVKKEAANQRAASRAAAAEQRKERADSAAETRTAAARRNAKTELDDAQETEQSAAEARTDAERLADLAEIKQQARKES